MTIGPLTIVAPAHSLPTMRITLELESTDLERFQSAFDRSRHLAAEADEVDIIDAAKHALDTLVFDTLPTYVRKRLVHVQRLIMMLEDDVWSLPMPDRNEALAALAYFGDPDDLIPDHIEVIGMVDDAIMLELIARRMRHVLHAYRRFCAFRRTRKAEPDDDASRMSTARELAEYRASLIDELSSRRERVGARVEQLT
ncbi:MAG TPA: YkvA family protein [Dokdonella sp.]|uniref:YkvA family protein n=1 Tax=Dokdonella sp. TaxID=2291710 RepID=UPI002D80770D|nr:YkvA family protein [Dokdonella sp.]HET9032813.1 YkvA family protein [Dokdonella sp.]